MNNHNGSNGNKFFEGFLLGALIGGAAVFLIGTQKGKKLLKTIADEGLGNLNDLIEEEEPLEEGIEEVSEVVQESSNGNGIAEEKTAQEAKRPIRKRFFRKK